jgi:VanZ family protein
MRAAITGAYLLCLYASAGIARPAVEHLRASNLLRLTVAVLFTAALPMAFGWRRKAAGWRRMLLRAGIVVLLLAAAHFLTKTPEEKLHFLAFGLLGWLMSWSLENKSASLFLPVVCVWLAGIGDELLQGLLQGLLPGRIFDLRDILFNGIGGTAGAAMFATGRTDAVCCD